METIEKEISKKEIGTIIFALEEYANILEIEKNFNARNYVYELIWKLNSSNFN